MEYRRVGNSGLVVSELSFGAATFGGLAVSGQAAESAQPAKPDLNRGTSPQALAQACRRAISCAFPRGPFFLPRRHGHHGMSWDAVLTCVLRLPSSSPKFSR